MLTHDMLWWRRYELLLRELDKHTEVRQHIYDTLAKRPFARKPVVACTQTHVRSATGRSSRKTGHQARPRRGPLHHDHMTIPHARVPSHRHTHAHSHVHLQVHASALQNDRDIASDNFLQWQYRPTAKDAWIR